jgi:urease accessory protein
MDARCSRDAVLIEERFTPNNPDSVDLLRLLQLADSALPVGGFAHSFGFESIVDYGYVQLDDLKSVISDWLQEFGALEGYYCALACRAAREPVATPSAWASMNGSLDARKQARESREASCAMGRRLLDLAARAFSLKDLPQAATGGTHYACSFGFVAGRLGIKETDAVPAFLHQSSTGLIAAFQRLMPIGHTQAHQVLFQIKLEIAAASARALQADKPVPSFNFLPETGSMRHPRLAVRLFMS